MAQLRHSQPALNLLSTRSKPTLNPRQRSQPAAPASGSELRHGRASACIMPPRRRRSPRYYLSYAPTVTTTPKPNATGYTAEEGVEGAMKEFRDAAEEGVEIPAECMGVNRAWAEYVAAVRTLGTTEGVLTTQLHGAAVGADPTRI